MTDKLIRTYISGPVRGCDMEERRRTFEEAERMILDRHEVPVNPLKNGLPSSANDHMHMAIDLGLIATCQKILMLPYWQKSEGAQEELECAANLGLEIEMMGRQNHTSPYIQQYNPFNNSHV